MSSKGSKENKITRLDIFSSTIFSIDYLYIYMLTASKQVLKDSII